MEYIYVNFSYILVHSYSQMDYAYQLAGRIDMHGFSELLLVDGIAIIAMGPGPDNMALLLLHSRV